MMRSDVRTLTLVDDSPWVFDLYREPLEDILGMQVRSILHTGQSGEELAKEIAAAGTRVLLLDGNLAGGVRGPIVLPEILRLLPGLRAIGFSNDPSYEEAFREAGAVGFVCKGTSDPHSVVREVAEAMGRSS